MFTSSGGRGTQAEQIKEAIDKFPGGLVETVTKTTTAKGSTTSTKLGPGIDHVDGTVPYHELEDRVPYVAASFTGWRYKKMKRVFDVCTNMNKDYVEAFERCRDIGKIRKRVDSLANCTNYEKKNYFEEEYLETLRYTYKWENHFKDNLRYKKPFIINGYEINEWFWDTHKHKSVVKEKPVVKLDELG